MWAALAGSNEAVLSVLSSWNRCVSTMPEPCTSSSTSHRSSPGIVTYPRVPSVFDIHVGHAVQPPAPGVCQLA